MSVFDEQSSDEKPAEVEYQYKGPLGFTLFWFLWSIIGYFYIVFIGILNHPWIGYISLQVF